MRPMRSHVKPVPEKTMGQKMAEFAIVYSVVLALFWVIQTICKVVLWPFRWLFTSRAQLEKEKLERAAEKIDARKARVFPDTDPMSEYLKRFVDSPLQYQDHADNAKYRTWYESWKRGEVLDTQMQWSPEVYEDGKICGRFVRYLARQVALHRKAGLSRWNTFANTLQKFYPEVNVRHLDRDVAELKERTAVASLRQELGVEISKLGISDEVAQFLIAMDLEVTELKRKAKVAKKCAELGYTDTLTKLYLEEQDNFSARSFKLGAEVMNNFNVMIANGCPVCIVRAFVRKEVTLDDLDDLGQKAGAYVKYMGREAYDTMDSGKSRIEEAFEAYLTTYSAKHRKKILQGWGA